MDYVIMPSDWKTVYLGETQNPNEFGEALRNYCFVGNCMETGCYSTFKLVDWLKEIKSGKIYEEAKKIINPEFPDSLHVFHFKKTEKDCWFLDYNPRGEEDKMRIGEPSELVCAWAWDGDGHLYFRWNDRRVENTDCKTNYTWRWVE